MLKNKVVWMINIAEKSTTPFFGPGKKLSYHGNDEDQPDLIWKHIPTQKMIMVMC